MTLIEQFRKEMMFNDPETNDYMLCRIKEVEQWWLSKIEEIFQEILMDLPVRCYHVEVREKMNQVCKELLR